MDEQELVYEEEETFPRTEDGYDKVDWNEDEYPSRPEQPSYPEF